MPAAQGVVPVGCAEGMSWHSEPVQMAGPGAWVSSEPPNPPPCVLCEEQRAGAGCLFCAAPGLPGLLGDSDTNKELPCPAWAGP